MLDGIISLVLPPPASAGPLALGTWWTLQKAQNIAVKQKSFIFVRAHPDFLLEGLKRDVIFDQVVGWRLQRFRNDDSFSLVSADDFRMFWARRMVDGVWAEWKDRTRVLSPLSTPFTLLEEIGVDSIALSQPLPPSLSLSLFLNHHALLSRGHHRFLCIATPSLLLLFLSWFFSPPTPAVRSWASKSGFGWPALVVRAWRTGSCPSTTASVVPPATTWWEEPSWWEEAQPKCRRAGASTIERAFGRRWGWRVRPVLRSRTVRTRPLVKFTEQEKQSNLILKSFGFIFRMTLKDRLDAQIFFPKLFQTSRLVIYMNWCCNIVSSLTHWYG